MRIRSQTKCQISTNPADVSYSFASSALRVASRAFTEWLLRVGDLAGSRNYVMA